MAVPFVWLNRCRRHCHVSGCVMTGHPHGGSEGVLPRVIKESTCARADYATLRATAHLTFCKNERCHHACECKLSMHHGDSWRCKCIVKFRSRQKNEATPQQSCVTDCIVRIGCSFSCQAAGATFTINYDHHGGEASQEGIQDYCFHRFIKCTAKGCDD